MTNVLSNAKRICVAILLIALVMNTFAQSTVTRTHEKFDKDWRFALGHSFDAGKDWNNGTGYFSYFAKAGYGDGAAAEKFDDRAWRILDLPHDWCVELPFSEKGGHSHGYKAIGRNFPENSVGWYRKHFKIDESDLGKKISIEFDGIHRNSIIWVNGFYLGTEFNGSGSFSFDITDYLNYGGDNVISVRADATMEEGWYYEGAGIYRHVWLTKTNPLHVAHYGTFVTTELNNNNAKLTVRTQINNESNESQLFDIEEFITNSDSQSISMGSKTNIKIAPGSNKEIFTTHMVANPKLWTLENPYLHKLVTLVKKGNKVIDSYETTFGIRTVRFDPNQGFFLNGKNIKIVGTNCHQDHAGVGTSIPDALQEFRVKKLKEMGNNGIRTSHNPATPELLDVCDRLGMLVLDENRLMGINDEHYKQVERLIKRDRNHPCVVLWSLGNEEWAIESNVKGARIATTMQLFAQKLDSSRAFTAACSGGWDWGTGTVTQVMGYNYIVQGDIDVHHKKFPWQSGIGTEESNTIGTRGIYQTNDVECHMAATNRMPENVGTESGWQFYTARPFLAGLFYWTGFDYRGESNPYSWPAVTSQFGIVDLCGFQKDIFYYLKSWWGKETVLHIFPHWNLPTGQASWQGKEGQAVKVTVYSNCDEVELFLNGKTISKQAMPVNGHLEWNVNYEPGILSAKGYKAGKEIITTKVETTGEAASLQLEADKNTISANAEDVSVITVKVTDNLGRVVPTAMNDIAFSLEGEGRIIGVGNGDPSSHEKEKFVETILASKISDLREFAVNNLDNRTETNPSVLTTDWKPAFTTQSKDWKVYTDSLLVVRGEFDLPELTDATIVNLFTKKIVENQKVFVNGTLIETNQESSLQHNILKPGKNTFAVTGKRFKKKYQWDEPNTDPGIVQIIIPAEQWKRKAFNGLAQVIVQSTSKAGEIKLVVTSPNLKQTEIKILTK